MEPRICTDCSVKTVTFVRLVPTLWRPEGGAITSGFPTIWSCISVSPQRHTIKESSAPFVYTMRRTSLIQIHQSSLCRFPVQRRAYLGSLCCVLSGIRNEIKQSPGALWGVGGGVL